ncbi:uncharacterized protein LY89DRAFT_585366 [Mollisia scopiformis]|uniref:Uncharacterized protein n=1 Tax=Mollisia scopiformis TaxID=149040 RepID=A0A194XA84_MOLSC|nr:uncharacterized protein LY89DRAFT_585366 [Mollisia scopiformis]KUJ17083.1 hypothetical protein LY89DRAFT_585366 [Mollisia scopiformis]
MSTPKIEATEPDPAAASIPNDETVNKENGDASAPTDVDVVAEETKAEVKEENGDAAEKKDVKSEDTEEANEEGKPKLRFNENGILKTSAKPIEGVNNSKYDASVLSESEDPVKIRAQVEFYFGDSNLPTDNYLWDLTGGSANKPVDLAKILGFGRMKRFTSREIVLAALKESKSLQVTGEKGEEQVNRRIAYDPTKSSRAESRSIYAKGFGDEEPSSQFDIEAFFAPYGPTNAVRLRRTDDRLFKGSVFVEFQDDETAKKFLDLDPKPLWQGKHTLLIQSKREYVEGKAQDIRDGKIDPQEARIFGNRGRGRGRGGRGRGRGGDFKRGDRDRNGGRERRDRDFTDRDPDDWKKRREEDRASGFKDDRKNGRNARDHHKKGGRGGRRDDRGHRDNDRNRERKDRDE